MFTKSVPKFERVSPWLAFAAGWVLAWGLYRLFTTNPLKLYSLGHSMPESLPEWVVREARLNGGL